ncbi:AAEL000595-PA [Aedes aegypti]|uniref:AAEL000595-PA n=1 Tax=Aedes aegypti TaxID=7159 RepID=Q17NU5_AEDAE|nr:AAEL000595-PA [Aedes aegypti]
MPGCDASGNGQAVPSQSDSIRHTIRSLALRLKTVHIPPYKHRGESALLQCQYELKGQQSHNGHSHHSTSQVQRGRPWNDSAGSFRHHVYHDHDYYSDSESGDERLYSIQWYKDNEEFYRYVPSASQPIKSYKIEGIRVDPNHSDGTKVMLKSLTLKSSGVYRCEVSAEAPNFDSVQGEGRMDVIYLPRDGPHINGSEKKSYHIGETMELNCTSGRSYPASTLQWYLNDKLVLDPRYIVHYPRMVNQHGLLTSFLGLSMVVQPHHYIDGSMKLKCVANLSPVLWRNGQESIMQWEQPPLDNRVAMLLVRSSSPRWSVSMALLLWSTLLAIVSSFRLHP